MKNKLQLVLLLFLSIVSSNCHKEYPENKKTIFYNPYKEIEGYWKVTKFTVDGVDSLGTMLFPRDHYFDFTSVPKVTDKEYMIYMRENNGKDSINLFGTIKLLKKKDEGKMFIDDCSTILVHSTGNYTTYNDIPPFLGCSYYTYNSWDIQKLQDKIFIATTTRSGMSYVLEMRQR